MLAVPVAAIMVATSQAVLLAVEDDKCVTEVGDRCEGHSGICMRDGGDRGSCNGDGCNGGMCGSFENVGGVLQREDRRGLPSPSVSRSSFLDSLAGWEEDVSMEEDGGRGDIDAAGGRDALEYGGGNV